MHTCKHLIVCLSSLGSFEGQYSSVSLAGLCRHSQHPPCAFWHPQSCTSFLGFFMKTLSRKNFSLHSFLPLPNFSYFLPHCSNYSATPSVFCSKGYQAGWEPVLWPESGTVLPQWCRQAHRCVRTEALQTVQFPPGKYSTKVMTGLGKMFLWWEGKHDMLPRQLPLGTCQGCVVAC